MPTSKKKRVRRLRYDYWRSQNGQHYAHLRSGSQILMATEGYDREREALKPGQAIERHLAADTVLVFQEILDPQHHRDAKGGVIPVPLPIDTGALRRSILGK